MPGPVTLERLVERDGELERLAGAAEAARGGRGSLLLVEGPAGQGKTALLRRARLQAADAGMRVLWAAGAPVERDFAFGVTRQLLETALAEAGPEERAELLSGAARLASTVFSSEPTAAPGADAGHAPLHGLFWLCANLAERRPLFVVVDDAHWADAPSLRFLDVLARRIEDLPIALVVGARPSDPGAEQELLDALELRAAAAVLRPADLSATGIAQLVEDALGGPADEAFVEACARSTGGSPLLVAELVRTLPAFGFTGAADEAQAVERSVPETVRRGVIARLRALSPRALAVARSVAVLGDDARLAHVASLADLTHADAVAEHAALAHAGVLERARVAFVQPMVREALLDELPAGERALLHRHAASLLARAGAPAAELAAHLAATDPAEDAWVAGVLVTAGRSALAQGAAPIARRLLARALVEPPPAAERPAVLLALGQAEAAAGDPSALAHLQEAARGGVPDVAARADLARAGILILANRADDAAAILRQALERGPPDDLQEELEEVLLSALDYDAHLVAEKRQLLAKSGSDGPVVLAHRAFEAALTGATQDTVVALAHRALQDGRLLAAVGEERLAGLYAIEALMIAEAAEEAAAARRLAATAARRSGSRLAAWLVAMQATRWEMLFGDLRQAEAQAQLGIELWSEGFGEETLSPAVWIALGTARFERGDVAGAEAAAARLPATERGDLGFHGIPVLRARLLLANRRPEQALELLEEQFAIERSHGWLISPRHNARAVQVAALADAGRGDEARSVAAEHAALAGARGSLGMQAPILVAAARSLPTEDAIAALHDAVAVARRSPMPRNVAHALAALGAAQRRGGQRTAARATLREARELAHRVGATGLAEQVLEELVIAGARPQRIALDGVDALTPSERRVAELAASGLRNKEIAETLFVTLKTVEVHLGRAYGKLGVQGRSQLPAALAGGTSGQG
jgi:DNA-binding CsgD family transcriptional regulator